MRRALSIALLAVLTITAEAWAAAGTATVTEISHTSVRKITWSWTSGTGAEGGTVTKVTTKAYDGRVIALTTDPGVTAPTDNYDIEVLDADGHDVLLGAGANRDTANTEFVTEASLGAVAGSTLTLSITNAGDAKVGVVVLWVR